MWYMVDRTGLHGVLYGGPKGVVMGLAAAWCHVHVDLGSYHNVIVGAF